MCSYDASNNLDLIMRFIFLFIWVLTCVFNLGKVSIYIYINKFPVERYIFLLNISLSGQ